MTPEDITLALLPETEYFKAEVLDWEGVPMYALTNKYTDVVEVRTPHLGELHQMLGALTGQLDAIVKKAEASSKRIKLTGH